MAYIVFETSFISPGHVFVEANTSGGLVLEADETLYYSRKEAGRDTIHVVRHGRVLQLYDGKEYKKRCRTSCLRIKTIGFSTSTLGCPGGMARSNRFGGKVCHSQMKTHI